MKQLTPLRTRNGKTRVHQAKGRDLRAEPIFPRISVFRFFGRGDAPAWLECCIEFRSVPPVNFPR